MLKALLWDVDGTLAETERDGHLVAFNQAFEALDVPWRWGQLRYGELLAIAGGRERLLYDMQYQARAPSKPEGRRVLAKRIHELKNSLYGAIAARGELPLREGVAELFADCANVGVSMGIVTTTSRVNAAALAAAHWGSTWASLFSTVIAADEAPKKKPDPQAYLIALKALRLQADEVIAIEDSPAGVAAARAAGIAVIVARSYYFSTAKVHGAMAVGPSLGRSDGWNPIAEAGAGRIDLGQIIRWYSART